MTRWDSPLFTVPWEDDTPPFAAIWEAMIGSDGKGKVVKPNQATLLVCPSVGPLLPKAWLLKQFLQKPATETDYLYELDKTTQEILNKILDWQKDHPGEGGGEIDLDNAGSLALPAVPLTLPQLQRIRRQFISLNRQHNLAKPRIRTSFIEYLNGDLR